MALTQISTDGIKNGTITGSDLATNVDLVDNQKLRLGTGNDLQIFHDGSNSYIEEAGTGSLITRTGTFLLRRIDNNNDMFVANGGGSVELYHNGNKKFETTSTGVKITGSNSTGTEALGDFRFENAAGTQMVIFEAEQSKMRHLDGIKATFGTGDDLQIFHDGTNTFINNFTGNLELRPKSGEAGVLMVPNGSTELYYDGVKKFETTSGGVQVTDNLNMSGGHIFLADDFKLNAGTSDDLQIYHDGSNSFISDAGTGGLKILGSAVYIKNVNDHDMVEALSGGAVSLFHNNSKKFETTSTGANVTSANDAVLKVTTTGTASTDDARIELITQESTFTIQNDRSLGTDGVLTISPGSEAGIYVFKDGVVQLYNDGSKKFETDSTGVTVTGILRADEIRMGDSGGATSPNERIRLGNSEDLQIFHDGSHSRVYNYTGNLAIDVANDIQLRVASVSSPEVGVDIHANGSVDLYHDGTKRFETVTDGAKCTGALEIFGVNQGVTAPLSANNRLRFTDNDSTTTSAQPVGTIEWYTNDGNNRGISGFISVQAETDQGRGRMVFGTGTEPAVERMRITESGNVLVGTTSNTVESLTSAGQGVKLGQSGRMLEVASNAQPAVGFNRTGDDGTIVRIIGQGSLEGTITVSGSSVSYNGGHLSRWSQFKGLSQTDKSDRPTIYQGTVMSNLDDLCVWEGEDNQQLNMTKISDVEGDKDVAGVFYIWDDDDDKVVNDFYVAMTGDLVIRVAATTTVGRGDLMISAGDGTAKPQADDIIRSSTIAKIISTNHTATYPDNSKAYPCVLMAC